MGLLRAIATVGGFTLISRILGFVRDILIAAILGAGVLADVFFVAFKFPNLFRRLFAEGAFNAAFVPIFTGLNESEGRDSAKLFAEEALSGLFWVLLLFIALIEIAMPLAMLAFAPGFTADSEKFDLAVLLTRITFPYLLFVSLVSLMGGVLNSLDRFAAAAATPILLNICLIGAILLLAPLVETAAHALAWGVAAAGGVQFIWLYTACSRIGMTFKFRRPRLTPRVRELLVKMLPLALGAGLYQVNLLIDTIIASLLPSGSISYLFFADRVNQLPLGVIGLAVGTALLAVLSRQVRNGAEAEALHSQNRALEFSLLLTLPAAAALMVISLPVISVLFERGEFGGAQSQATAAALAVYAAGLPAYVAVKALAPGFFARGDTATPIKVGAICMLVNLALNLALMKPLLHVGIAAATAISAWLNVIILSIILKNRGHLQPDVRLKSRLPRAILASIGMGVVLWAVLPLLQPFLNGGLMEKVTALALLVIGGATVFGGLAQLLGAASYQDIKSLRRADNLPSP
ncbi:MAG: murein biosynthesis integral membrane protein MurJ [Rhodospirillales bacterium]|nr:murein biosynthesis integral membrane protein MurJ [Rhodospirillales bacterium]